MAPKVDSLNIVSNTKPLSIVSKPEINSEIEVFENKKTKASIDEIGLSNQNNNKQIEEKSDNKKKWLIGAGIILGTLAVGVASYFLFKKINAKNLNIIHNDVLKVDFSQFGTNLKVVANIPYYITSPILAHLLGEINDLNNKNRNCIDEIILMVQYEVAQRLVAKETSPSKQYGLLTILAQFFAEVELIKKVPAKCFYPRPKVDSALVKFKVRKTPLLELSDYNFFRKVLKAAFASRRKNIKNCLSNAGFNKNIVQKTLEDLNISENTRGESLSIEIFGILSEKLKENLCNK